MTGYVNGHCTMNVTAPNYGLWYERLHDEVLDRTSNGGSRSQDVRILISPIGRECFVSRITLYSHRAVSCIEALLTVLSNSSWATSLTEPSLDEDSKYLKASGSFGISLVSLEVEILGLLI